MSSTTAKAGGNPRAGRTNTNHCTPRTHIPQLGSHAIENTFCIDIHQEIPMLVGFGLDWKPVSYHPRQINSSIQSPETLNRVLDPGIDLRSNSDVDDLRNVMISSNDSQCFLQSLLVGISDR
jgi:hypothetical protein